MGRTALAAALAVSAVALSSPTAAAQWHHHGPHGFGFVSVGFLPPPAPFFRPGPYAPWVGVGFPPPLAVVAVPVAPTAGPLPQFEDLDDVRGKPGIDLAAVHDALRENRRAERQADARLNDAVTRGDLLVVAPNGPRVNLPDRREPPKPPVKLPAEPVPPTDPAALAEFHFRRGADAFRQGQFGLATERLDAAIKANPTRPEPRDLLIRARVARGQYAEAAAAVRAAMAAIPGWESRKPQPDADRETDDLARAVAADPADAAARFVLAHQLWQAGRRDDARPHFRRLADTLSDPTLPRRFLAVEK